MKRVLLLLMAVSGAVSCVPAKKYNAMRAEALRYESGLEAANTRIGELDSRNRSYAEQVAQLEMELIARRGDIASLNEQALRARDEAIASIRRKVTDALIGFDGKGLTIFVRNGMVYVSMEDRLLFRSGSFDMDPNGAQAVSELAKVLAANPDINVMVEGHTDTVPYRPNGNLQDNLDLSVKRATTVVRLLLRGESIGPERITAAGRGEWIPVDSADTPEARARNRRTEIILTPNLKDILQLTSEL